MTLRSRLLRLLWAGPVALGVCYFALWACAPVFTQPPPVPIADERNRELGFSGGTAVDLSAEALCSDGLVRNGSCTGPQLQAYYRSRVSDRVELSVVAHGGVVSFFGAGAQVRGYLVDKDAVKFGLTGQLGWLWGAVGVPVAGKLTDGLWLYTEPTGSFALVGMARLPVGVSWDVANGVGVGLEGGAMTGINGYGLLPYGNLRISAAF